MVAKIITGKSLRGALQYNENKVAEGKAELILSNGFAGDIEQMNFHQKLQRFENLLMLNPKVKTNTLHISLNFDASEKLTNETLQQIAMTNMEKIGFGNQPFIVYRHHDAGHEHVHLVSTNIKADGSRIDLHNIGANQSEKARKEIEETFNLVKAQHKHYKPEPGIKAIDVQKVIYGKLPTKRAISNTVNAIINNYHFTSLAELNAVLEQFNVIADRGATDSIMFQKKGLVYSLLDEKGNKVGVPIKSSSLYSKPTLFNLEKQFPKHEQARLKYKPHLKQAIDEILSAKPKYQIDFAEKLKAQGIATVFRIGNNGQVFGITFVDHKNKTVFNGSDLGKAYSAKSILSQLNQQQSFTKNRNPLQSKNKTLPIEIPIPSLSGNQTLLNALLKEDYAPSAQQPKKKKRKKLNI